MPHPFVCSIVPRSPQAEDLIYAANQGVHSDAWWVGSVWLFVTKDSNDYICSSWWLYHICVQLHRSHANSNDIYGFTWQVGINHISVYIEYSVRTQVGVLINWDYQQYQWDVCGTCWCMCSFLLWKVHPFWQEVVCEWEVDSWQQLYSYYSYWLAWHLANLSCLLAQLR
jgi:hypothetical protein